MEKRKQLSKRSGSLSASSIATKDSQLVREIVPLMNLPEDHDKAGFLKALQKFEVTETELEEGFWKAYADHFVPQSGIEFRHIYKHISEQRQEAETRKAKYYI